MTNHNCTHERAIPSPDFASAGGYYCPDCRSGCQRPAIFAPPPGRSVVSAETTNPPLLTTSLPVALALPPKEEPTLRGNDDLSEESHSKQLVSDSKQIQTQDVYEVSSQGRKYFRYIVNDGHKIMDSIHVKGGNINSPIAQARAEKIRRWIAHGLAPAQIVPMIQQWR